MHNGIINGLGNHKKSDTCIYTEKLDKKYTHSHKDLITAIQKASKKYGGSFSIVVYEKATKKVYYYKESWTKMYKIEDADWLIMSTTSENLKYAKFLFDIKTEIKEVDSYKIYNVLEDFKEEAKFEDKFASYNDNYKGYQTTWDAFDSKNKTAEKTSQDDYKEENGWYLDENGVIVDDREDDGKEFNVYDYGNRFGAYGKYGRGG